MTDETSPSNQPLALAHAVISPQNFGLMGLLVILWGLSIPITKLGLQTLPPMTLTSLRFAIATPLLFLFCLSKPVPWRSLPRISLLGIVGIGFGQAAQSFGIEQTSASVGTTLSATIPLFVVLFASIRLRQSVSVKQGIGLLAAFAGIVLVAADKSGGAPSTLGGIAWMLASAISIALYYVLSVEISHRHGTPLVAAWSTLFGLISLLPFSLVESAQGVWHLTLQGLLCAAYLAVAVAVVGLFIWLHLLRTVPASIAASTQYLQPVVGLIAAALMFGERLGMLFVAGVILVLAGIALAATNKKRF